jgi:hypothetical protein
METVLSAIGVYLILGALILTIFEVSTRRVTRNLRGASTDAQLKMAQSGTAVGSKSVLILTFAVMWLFWPAVLIGASKKDKNKEGKEQKIGS